MKSTRKTRIILSDLYLDRTILPNNLEILGSTIEEKEYLKTSWILEKCINHYNEETGGIEQVIAFIDSEDNIYEFHGILDTFNETFLKTFEEFTIRCPWIQPNRLVYRSKTHTGSAEVMYYINIEPMYHKF